MDYLLVLKTYESYLEAAWAWLIQNAVSLGLSGIAQIVVVGLCLLAARQGAARGQLLLERVSRSWRYGQQLRRVATALEPLTLPIMWLFLQWLVLLIAAQAMLPHQLIKIVASLLTAWVVIRMTTTLVHDPTWARLIAIAAWTIAALNIVLLGVFAFTAFNSAGANGLIFGNAAFLGKQVTAAVISSVWAFAFTYGMLWLIDRVTPVKVEQAAEESGLDAALHGETAYLGTP